MEISEKVVKIADDYAAAIITEIQVNNGFTDKKYEHDIASLTGWYHSAEWCAAAAILDWKLAYADNAVMLGHINRLVSLNSQQMANNFHADPVWPTSVNIPKMGAIVVWALGDTRDKGHTGIVVDISADGKTFTSVEGNTSSPDKPETRTGWTIAKHVHTIGLPHSSLNLNLDRFIYCLESYSPLVLSE